MRRRLLALLLPALMAAAVFFAVTPAADANIQTACPGNVCSNSASVGGHNVSWYWTQNQNTANSSIKVRFQTPAFIAGGGTVRFKIYVTKAFSNYDSLKNPDPTTTIPPIQSVDVSNLWIERSMVNPAVGTVFDFTQELKYDALPTGQVDLTIEIAQYGSVSTFAIGTVPLQHVEFDPTAPTNRNEGDAFPAPPYANGYLNCQDGVDNDLNYVKDCADSNCLGKTIQSSPLRTCEATEVTCNDGLDNDGDGKADCADPDCNGKPGNPAGDKFCGPENGGAAHANCADGFDNDGNGKTDCTDDTAGTGCWKTGFQDCAASETSCTDNIDNDRDSNYSETLDTNPGTGIDCSDYDCKGRGNCPTNERLAWNAGSGTFVDTPSQCFDGLDNDLDGKKDCADPDCLGATSGGHSCASYEAYLPPSPLGTGAATSTPASYFNFCNDGIDNDGNGLTDGADPTCKNRFGECSPFGALGLAATEDISFLSCADTLDNDLNGAKDCADAACRSGNKLGRGGCTSSACGGSTAYTSTDAAVCTATENQPQYCGDGLDNNNNGQIDCADAGCSGVRHGPAVLPGFMCGAETGAANCSDGYDNDGNGNIDCLDSACQTGVTCALRNWSLAAACVPVPDTTALASIIAGGSVQYAHDDRLHVGDQYHVRFKGTGSYTSLTIVVGDAVVPANAFPFNATTCAVSGTGAASVTYTSTDPRVGTLALKSGSTFASGFDLTLTCTGSAVVIGPPADAYTIDYVANHAAAVEFGEALPAVQVYENVAPVLSPTAPAPTPGPAVDVEGVVAGKVTIPVGGTVRFQAKPGDAAPSSGICSCAFNLNGSYQVSPDGNCTVSKSFVNDVPSFQVTTSALDGAWNRSATTTVQTVNVDVTPSVSQNMTIAGNATTFRGGSTMTFSAAFQTDTLSTFPGPCHLFVYNDSWAGAEAGTVAWTPSGVGTPLLTCAGTYTVPAALSAGRYFLVVETTDSSGDMVRSNAQTMLKCENADVGTGQCKDADFDNDGVPEGRFTPNAYASPPAPQYKAAGQQSACDNCINLSNPNQLDTNGNGVGEACEASAVGRCQYKYCGSSPTDPTPGGHCSVDSDCTAGDTCVVVSQSMCTINCALDADCSPPTAPIAGGSCVLDWGICTGPAADQGNCCFNNSDCTSGTCDNLVKPFLQTLQGQLFAAGSGGVQGQSTPPISNATYCVASAGVISNFTSAAGCSLANVSAAQAPTSSDNYGGTFGSIDVNGILGGKYGTVTNGGVIANPLNNQIILYNPGSSTGLTVSSPISFANGSGATTGGGLIVVKGDLVINADVTYQNTNVSDLKQLASVGWLVLMGPTCAGTGPGCGNVSIAGNVQNFAGAVFAEGVISTGVSSTELNATGAWVAKDYQLQRTFSSRTGGAEKVTYDPRMIMNPPPGMTDAARSLPSITAVPAQ